MTHKEAFQKSNFSKGYNEVIDGPQMQAALNATMLHMQSTFSMPSDMGTAASNEFRRQGAVQFRMMLEGIMTNQSTPSPATGSQLTHQR